MANAKAKAAPSKAAVLTDENAASDFLDQLESMDTAHMQEVTSSYHKFVNAGEKIVGIFKGYEQLQMEQPDGSKKPVDCIVLQTKEGRKLFGQTVIVGAIKERDVEMGTGVVIIYNGKAGSGTNKYDSFRVLTSPVS